MSYPYLPMDDRNCVKIRSGEKTSTLRSIRAHETFYKGDGIYRLPDNTRIQLECLGYKMVHECGGAEKVAQTEGFPSADEFRRKCKFQQTRNFLDGKCPLYYYRIQLLVTEGTD